MSERPLPAHAPGITDHTWPEITAEEFTVTIDMDSAPDDPLRPVLVLRVGDQEIYRERTGYENGDHIIAVCRALRPAYAGRVKDFTITPRAINGIYLDDWQADAKLKRAFRGLRKDYMKRKIDEKRQCRGE